jgi:hypothetical protein
MNHVPSPFPRRVLNLSALLCALGAGCGGAGAESAAAETVAKPAVTPARPRDFRKEPAPAQHMQANFWVAVELRDAVVDGELDKARQLGTWLAEHDLRRTLPAPWAPWVKDMQTSAAEVAAAPDLSSAAQAVGSLGVSCGGCHWNFGVSGPRVPDPDEEDQGFAPEGPEDLTTRMLRHQWAADELWFGLTIPSEQAWKDGAQVLIDSPFEPPVQNDQPVAPELARGIEAMRELGRTAQHAGTMGDRSRVYGKLLASCAGCHTKDD